MKIVHSSHDFGINYQYSDIDIASYRPGYEANIDNQVILLVQCIFLLQKDAFEFVLI